MARDATTVTSIDPSKRCTSTTTSSTLRPCSTVLNKSSKNLA
jgi:hypothetical protein